ncbi:MAG: hypothetical protein C6W58_11515 [Bacillaceae bacterium]|nr:MAG: hypothetical protein C6W58_11515 [Bacillaceae bacterium]
MEEFTEKILGKLLTTVSSLITPYGNNLRAEPSLIGIKFRSTFICYGGKNITKTLILLSKNLVRNRGVLKNLLKVIVENDEKNNFPQ